MTTVEKEVVQLSWHPSLPEDQGGRREGGRSLVWGLCSGAPCLAGDSHRPGRHTCSFLEPCPVGWPVCVRLCQDSWD